MEEGTALGEKDWQAETEHLQRSMLPALVPVVALAGWVWLVFVLNRERAFGSHAAPAIVLFVSAFVGHRLGRRHYTLACWLLLLGVIGAQTMIALRYPSLGVAAYGVVVVLVAHALLGLRQASLVMLLSLSATLWASSARAEVASEAGMGPDQLLILYVLCLAGAWLAARPLRQSAESALTGWVRARDALLEVRQRRAELYRVVRALEEATYRIEHMNGALLVARREAEEAQALKARFAAMVSHEIRGPLNLILGFSRMMALFPERYGERLPTVYHEDVDTIYRNSEHLLALVDDVLDLSQIEAQKLALVKDRIDLQEDVVAKVVSNVEPLAHRKGLYLRQELAGSLPWILADAVRLRQALLNLLTNAIRFTEHGGVTVRTEQRDNRLVVAVEDTGPGIAPEGMAKLFKEFHQIRSTEARHESGSGLGLSICKHLVELHGGEVRAESRIGVGTTFLMSLPLPATEPAAAPLLRMDNGPQPSELKACLVVHEDPAVVRVLSRSLEGYRVVGVLDSHEVLPLAEDLRPRAVVTSPSLAKHVSEALAQGPHGVPVVECALPQPLGQPAIEGVLAYLAKPVLPEVLSSIMRRVLRDVEATALLVDDDPDAVRLLERMLTALPHPYTILKAYSGQQALESMSTTIPDVVFLDWVMPEMDGEEVIVRMRADARLCNVPVVIVSARDWVEDRATMGKEMRVVWREPLPMARGIKCLQSLLDALSPDYLAGPGRLERP